MGAAGSVIDIPSNLTIAKFDRTQFPKGGVRLSFFNEFIQQCGGRDACIGKTTSDVCSEIIMKLTGSYACSVCDLLHALNHTAYAGKADVFISHAWKYHFLDVVDILEDHFKDRPDVIIWFDLF